MAARARALTLYRDIMRAHRKLPVEMRTLGDAYVREEFKKHKAAKPKFLAQLYTAWDVRALQAALPQFGAGREPAAAAPGCWR